MKRLRKVTACQRHQLLQIYLHMGQEVAGRVCVEWGLAIGYAADAAYDEGYPPPRLRVGHPKGSRYRNDPRWNWAIDRGAVST